MTRTNSMLIRWRVQTRASRTSKWANRGLFETRKDAREVAKAYREPWVEMGGGYGFGNTRVVRHEGKGK